MRRSHSFSTIESCSLDSAGAANLRTVEGDWQGTWHAYSSNAEIVSDSEDDCRFDDSGILIVSPEEENEEIQQASLTLSVPESIPSNVGSVAISAHQNSQDDRADSGSLSSSTSAGSNGSKSLLSKRISLGMAVMFFLLFCASAASYVVWERKQFEAKTLRVEEENQLLKKQLETTEKNLQDAQKNPPHGFASEENCSGSTPFATTSPGIDNCWVHAHANVKLGECAQETKENAVKNFRKFQKKAKKNFKKVATKVREFKESETAQQAKESIKNGFKTVGKNLKQAQEGLLATMRDADVFSFAAEEKDKESTGATTAETTPKDRLRQVGKTAAKMVTGVAFLSVAAAAVSVGFLLGDNEDS